MSWSDVSEALDYALSLPRKPRSNAIDHAQLREKPIVQCGYTVIKR